MHSTQTSAPGKVLLTGEHAVVYGKKALALSLGLRCNCTIKPETDKIILNLPNLNVQHSWTVNEIVNIVGTVPFLQDGLKPAPLSTIIQQSILSLSYQNTGVAAFLYLYICFSQAKTKSIQGANVTLESQLPIGAGLGSSASFSVAITAGLLLANGIIEQTKKFSNEQLDLINQWAFQAEKYIHGSPSGVDNAVSTYGGALIFTKGKIDHLKSIPPLQFMLINTKVSRNTKLLVEGVRTRFNKFTDIIDPILTSIDNISTKCLELFNNYSIQNEQSFEEALGELMVINNHLLNSIGVGHQSLEKICTIADTLKFPCKLTGAGGGGCAIALITASAYANLDLFKKALQENGYEYFETRVGGNGVLPYFE